VIVWPGPASAARSTAMNPSALFAISASTTLVAVCLGHGDLAAAAPTGAPRLAVLARSANSAQQAEMASLVSEMVELTLNSNSVEQWIFLKSLGNRETVVVNVVPSGAGRYDYASLQLDRTSKTGLDVMLNVVFEYVVPPGEWQVFHDVGVSDESLPVISRAKRRWLIGAASVVLAHIASGQPVTTKQLGR
jgi:hypothetical protein